ncbi:hypothetical protein [Maribacter polysaccharolyticus]|uniref:hypothetical protein n=1 Tax=Maribacter polysaccharolyticus TaxID=3020831 RepID=UPI00237EFA3E|nr:hypothetical protein [Maribacter polysaccharolyticus]MDE3741727.1 hypothetical protein [Maribacter polysaccharolyticus]
MPISIQLKAHKDFVEAEFTGTRDSNNELEETIRVWSEIPPLCEKHGLNKILTITNLDKRLKLDNSFLLADKLIAIGFKPDYKLSAVITDDKLRLEYEVLATFIRNFGYECEIFATIKEAKKWLLQS